VSTALRIQNMIRSREPGTFFGGGVVAGLLLFVAWFALLPSNRTASTDPAGESTSGQVQGPVGANGEILSAITGRNGVGGNSFGGADASDGIQDTTGMEGVEDGDVPFTGTFGEGEPGTAVASEGGVPPQEGFLEAYAEIDGVRVPDPQPAAELALQPWYVEVARDGGQVEILQVNAQSAEQALQIVRDYRGNPQVVRGPSTQPPY